MKKKQVLGVLVCAVTVVALVCAITACGGGAGDGPPLVTAATLEELTAKMAAASSGDTIALTSQIVLTGSLTVPAGVTLDITAANAALALGNNAVFTVDGTVNTKGITGFDSYGIVLMPEGTATINGSGIIRLKSEGQLLIIQKGQKLILDGNVTFDGLWKEADTSDTQNNTTHLVLVEGVLEMRGGKITGNYNTNDWYNEGDGIDGGGVEVKGEQDNTAIATFIMSGSAEVSGNRAKLDGGGVNVCHGGTFIMKDNAKVSNNIAERSGGGVRVRQDAYPATSFTLEGGTVTGNTALDIDQYGGTDSNSLIVYDGSAKWGTTSTNISGGGGSGVKGDNILGGDGRGTTNDNLSAVGP